MALWKGDRMKIDCDIVKDLLPLYTEQLVSEKSRMAIEEHLEECEVDSGKAELLDEVEH